MTFLKSLIMPEKKDPQYDYHYQFLWFGHDHDKISAKTKSEKMRSYIGKVAVRILIFSLVVNCIMGVYMVTIAVQNDEAQENTTEVKETSSHLKRFQTMTDMLFSQYLGSKEGSFVSKCFACKLGIGVLQRLIQTGKSESEIMDAVASICKLFKIQSPTICNGITNVFKDEVIYVLSKVALTPKEVCGVVLGDSCAHPYNPYHNWTVPLPSVPKPPVLPIPPPQPGYPVTRVLHLSDVHFDPYYMEGSNAVCGEPLCCQIFNGKPAKPEDAAGKWGDYRSCDTVLRTLEHMLKHIKENDKIDYIIWTGDIPPHDVWNQTRSGQIYVLHRVSELLRKHFPVTPIYPSLGNHESVPVNSFPPPEVTGKFSISWLYDELVSAWQTWLPQDALQTLKKGAYYSVLAQPGLRVISLNMNYCNNINLWLLLNMTDPANELEWLITELQAAEIKGEKVHIIGHIPPGGFDCLKAWSWNYYRIIERYESTVTAQFFGHTHKDEFELFYDTAELKRPTSIAYIGPSVTTFDNVNPGYRIYIADGNYQNSSRMVLDHETYFMNLTEANLLDRPVWKKEYSAKEAYNMSSLLPSEWDRLITVFKEDDDLFQQYYRYYMKLSDYYTGKTCTGACKTELLCDMRSGRSHDPDLCKNL